MKRFVITEEERKRILKMHLNENTPSDTNIPELPKEIRCVMEKIGGSVNELPESCRIDMTGGDNKQALAKCMGELISMTPGKAIEITMCFSTGIGLPKIPGIPGF